MRLTLGLTVLVLAPVVLAAEEPIVPGGAKVEKVWGEGTFTEGPAQGPLGVIYFTDIGNRIMMFDPATGKASEFRNPSGKANGLDFDAEGRLLACEGAAGGNRRVTRTENDGKITVLAERWNGKKFNSPNDLTVDTKGRVYFSDPRYGGGEPREIDTESVYRIDPDGKVTQLIASVGKPNGVLLSPDMKTLYVADNNAKDKKKLLLAFPLKEDGSVGEPKELHDFGAERGIDGMCCDGKGNIYGAAGSGKTAGVTVFSPEGKVLATIPTPDSPTNCVFGGKDRKTLFITAGKSLYKIDLNAEGFAVYRP